MSQKCPTCDDCGSKNWPDWTLLPHEVFNSICPGGNGYLCLPCFAKRVTAPQALLSAKATEGDNGTEAQMNTNIHKDVNLTPSNTKPSAQEAVNKQARDEASRNTKPQDLIEPDPATRTDQKGKQHTQKCWDNPSAICICGEPTQAVELRYKDQFLQRFEGEARHMGDELTLGMLAEHASELACELLASRNKEVSDE